MVPNRCFFCLLKHQHLQSSFQNFPFNVIGMLIETPTQIQESERDVWAGLFPQNTRKHYCLEHNQKHALHIHTEEEEKRVAEGMA